MPHLPTNGIQTHYKYTPTEVGRAGPAPTIVFIHGLGTDSLASFYLTLAAPLSAAGFNLLAYDLRGHGRSDRPPDGYRTQDLVEDLHDLIEQVTPPGPVHLVGNSFGGTLAYAYAWQHPQRAASVVTIESEPPTETWSQKMTSILDTTLELMAREDTYDWILANRGSHHARLARLANGRIRSTGMATQIPTGRLMATDDLQRFPCPVLNIIGSGGYQAETSHLLEALLPDCTTLVLEGEDHSALVEAHRSIRTALIDWVNDHRAAEAAHE